MKYKLSKKIKLTPTDISSISISLRESVKNAKKEDFHKTSEHNEYINRLQRLQKRFQRIAVKIEKEVLKVIQKSSL